MLRKKEIPVRDQPISNITRGELTSYIIGLSYAFVLIIVPFVIVFTSTALIYFVYFITNNPIFLVATIASLGITAFPIVSIFIFLSIKDDDGKSLILNFFKMNTYSL